MTDLSKIDISKARQAMSSDDHSASKLERVNPARSGRGHGLPDQLGQRMRTVFLTPETHGSEFNALLKQISDLLS